VGSLQSFLLMGRGCSSLPLNTRRNARRLEHQQVSNRQRGRSTVFSYVVTYGIVYFTQGVETRGADKIKECAEDMIAARVLKQINCFKGQ